MKTGFKSLAAVILMLAAPLACSNEDVPDDVGQESEIAAADSVNQEYYSMTYSERRGKELFTRFCVVCHGDRGLGDGFNSYNLQPRPRNLADTTYMNTLSDGRLHEIIQTGGRGTGKSVLMPAYGSTLDESEIIVLVDYIRYLGRTASP